MVLTSTAPSGAYNTGFRPRRTASDLAPDLAFQGQLCAGIMLSSHLCWACARRGMVARFLSFEHNLSAVGV